MHSILKCLQILCAKRQRKLAVIYIGAVVFDNPATEPWQTNATRTWNAGVMSGVNDSADFYVAHNYFTPYNDNSNASVIFSSALSIPQTMMSYLTQALQCIQCKRCLRRTGTRRNDKKIWHGCTMGSVERLG